MLKSLRSNVYLADTGLLQQWAQVSSGHVFENALAVQLRQFGHLRYYQRKTAQGWASGVYLGRNGGVNVPNKIIRMVSIIRILGKGCEKTSTYQKLLTPWRTQPAVAFKSMTERKPEQFRGAVTSHPLHHFLLPTSYFLLFLLLWFVPIC